MDAEEPRPEPAVHDLWPRVLLCPVLGFTIPNLAGLIDHGAHSAPGLAASYLFFSLVAFAIWEGTRWLHFRLHDFGTWLTRPWKRLGVLLGMVVFYAVPLATLSLGGWAVVTGDPSATWPHVAAAVLLVALATLAIIHVYETMFLLREWESDRVRSERRERQRLEAELEALKTEVDPHVLFNHLNSLSYLVDAADPRAPAFVTALGASYRALLRARGRRLVPLAEELELLGQFRELTAIRLGGAVRVDVRIAPDAVVRWHLPPIVLPELIENAIKHNRAEPAAPVTVTLALDEDCLVVTSTYRPHENATPSTGVGLRNLAGRFRLTTGRPATWTVLNGAFRVTLPLVAAGAEPQVSSSAG